MTDHRDVGEGSRTNPHELADPGDPEVVIGLSIDDSGVPRGDQPPGERQESSGFGSKSEGDEK